MNDAPSDSAIALAGTLRRLVPEIERLRGIPVQPSNITGAFSVVTVDLSDPAFSGKTGGTLGGSGGISGFGLVYLQRGSHPGALLELDCGGTIENFAPGDRVRASFSSVKIRRLPGSSQTGFARILVLLDPTVDYQEAEILDAAQPVALLGTFDDTGAPSQYITVTEDTDPTGSGLASAFDISGWNQIEVWMDGNSAAANATSWDVVPWCDPAYGGNWHEQGTARLAIPDTDTTGGRFRMFTMSVAGRGRMAFAVRNLLAAARTGVGFAIRGIR